MSKKVIVTGVLGQDGANMVEFLLKQSEKYKIYGMMRRTANPNFINVESFKDHPDFEFVCGDLADEVSLNNLVKDIQPDYLINFAANSFVGVSWDMPIQVFDTNALGVIRCLEAIRKFKPDCKFYSAGSSEEFGDVDFCPQTMAHPVKPRSPYGASKAAARHIIKVYRESYGLYAVHGILFNHEGTKRGEEFVTRKISKGVAKIYNQIYNVNNSRYGHQYKYETIELGNVYSKRDWSDSEDFVEGVWLMLNQVNPKDYILSSGETHTIKEFVTKAFNAAGIKGNWHEEQGVPQSARYIMQTHHTGAPPLVVVNPKFFRPAEVEVLMGDSSEVRQELGWEPKISFDMLVEKMVKYDIEKDRKHRFPASEILDPELM